MPPTDTALVLLQSILAIMDQEIGAGGQVVIWSALVIAVVLVGGCLMLLRLGQRQLALARYQAGRRKAPRR